MKEWVRMDANMAVVSDGVALRAMTAADLGAAHALTDEMHWPHRPADWEQVFRFGEGIVAERDGNVVGVGMRWRWGQHHATIGHVVVTQACQGRRIGHRLMSALLKELEGCSVLLNATTDGRGLYERLGFTRVGEVRQHQGSARASPPIALEPGQRLRPATKADAATLRALDAAARGMHRDALIDELFRDAQATVMLDHDGTAQGFGMLRRFGRGHAIGPVVAANAEGAKALIAHLAGLNAGRFTRIDIDFDSGLAEWVESLGLLRVDAVTTMLRGAPLPAHPQTRLYAVVTQALG
ncbi:MAG TPA: GNAT family N-acetyltransferase [Candidatus Kryptonia bacterium]|nr:GNAT family N-acetyltransferase [Candidatus Kryptonia bacterium]